MLDQILSKYKLTQFQKDSLNTFFDILNQRDPEHTKMFNDSITGDDELLLYYHTESGLINVIFNPEDCVAFSFISKTKVHKTKLLSDVFYFVDTNDFDKLVTDFLSY